MIYIYIIYGINKSITFLHGWSFSLSKTVTRHGGPFVVVAPFVCRLAQSGFSNFKKNCQKIEKFNFPVRVVHFHSPTTRPLERVVLRLCAGSHKVCFHFLCKS